LHDDNTFIMPDDNVTLQPVFEDMTSVSSLNYSTALAGTLREGWRAVQENNETHEYPSSYSAGARVFSGFTGHQGKALYWREGYAEYGRQSAYPLELEAGMYRLTHSMAAWSGNPRYKVQILDAQNNVIAESSSTLSYPNVEKNSGGNITNAKNYTLEFRVEAKGKHYIKFINATNSSGYDEYLLAECKLNTMVDPTSIDATECNADGDAVEIYSITGVRQPSFTKGMNIIRTSYGKTRKILIK
ncbi:MAG: glycosyl hydrolase family 98, partial [Bacteroidaceae bacterium]|nr:glycosyl hydrolase family 98 [Bacteroidaceae bacterium]